eukprot:m.139546 g.139546  ORF g.139546 m.139546 type:complete len:82 (+) comp17630_c0_seq1:213-458(+)
MSHGDILLAYSNNPPHIDHTRYAVYPSSTKLCVHMHAAEESVLHRNMMHSTSSISLFLLSSKLKKEYSKTTVDVRVDRRES